MDSRRRFAPSIAVLLCWGGLLLGSGPVRAKQDAFMATWVDRLCAHRPAAPAVDASLASTGSGVSAPVQPGQWDVALANYGPEPVSAAAIALDRKAIAAAMASAGAKETDAIEAVAADGTVVPVLPSPDGDKLVLLVRGVAAKTTLFLKLRRRAGGWPDVLADGGPGKPARAIANGLVVCSQTRQGLTISLGADPAKARAALEQITLGGTVTLAGDKPRPFRLGGMRGGVNVEKLADGIRYTSTLANMANAGVDFAHSVTLRPGRMIAEYSFSIANTGKSPVQIGETLLRGRFGEVMRRPDKTVHQPVRKGRAVVESVRKTLRLAVNFSRWGAITNAFTLGVRDRGGYGLGVVSSWPWSFKPTLKINATEFRLTVLPATKAKPLTLAPGQKVTGGLTFLLCTPGQDPYRWAMRVYTSRADKTDAAPPVPPAAGSPLAVFLGGRGVLPTETRGVHASPRTIGRVVAASGTVSVRGEAIRLTKAKGDAALVWFLTLPQKPPARLTVDVAVVSPGARLDVVVCDSAGRELSRTPVLARTGARKPLAVRLPDDGKPVRIALCLSGAPKAYADIRSVDIGQGLLPAPVLQYPRDGADVTDFAFEPIWEPVEDAQLHQLQIATSADFAAAHLVVNQLRKMPGDAGGQPPLPRLAAGRYWWRVRAWRHGPAGAWSKARSMRINRDYVTRAVDDPASYANPKFIFHGPATLKHAIPSELRKFVMRRGQPTERMAADDLDVVAVNTNLAALEHWFQMSRRVRGVMICERFWKVYHDDEAQRRNATRRLRLRLLLCAKYGKVFFWSDGNGNKDHWGPLGADAEWMALFRRYRDHVIVGNKSNVWMAAFSTDSQTQGLWLTGASSQLMSSLEWWYWRDVGFTDKLDAYAGRNGGLGRYIPPAVYVQQFLVGMCQGASVYQIGTVHIVGDPAKSPGTVLFTPEGKPTAGLTRHILPFVRFVAEQRPVPSREQVLKGIRVAVAIDEKARPQPVRRNLRYGIYEALYRGTYGFDQTPWKHHLDKRRADNGSIFWEYIPNTGRYGMFPLLPLARGTVDYAAALAPGTAVVPLSRLQSVQAVKAVFDKHYPPVESEAFVSRWGESFVVINSHENKDIAQRYVVQLGQGWLRAIEGSVGVHACLLGTHRKGVLHLHVNTAHTDRPTRLSLLCAARPALSASPAGAIARQQWDSAVGRMTVELDHAAGAVELRVAPASRAR